MRLLLGGLLAIRLVSAAIAISLSPNAGAQPDAAMNLPGAFILDVGCGSADGLLGSVVEAVDSVLDIVLATYPTAVLRHRFDSLGAGLCGLSVQFDVQLDVQLDELKAIAGVKNVVPVRTAKLALRSPAPASETPKLIRKSVEPLSTTSENRLRLNKRAPAPSAASPHTMTGVDQLHAAGLFGDPSIKVCLIDSGVDYKNKLLGGCFGKGCKIAFGKDYVGDAGNNPQPTPYAGCDAARRSTQATGIFGGDSSDEYEFIGVSPRVTIGQYRVYDCFDGNSTNDIVVAAFQQAARDGCNVITTTAANPDGWSQRTDNFLVTTINELVARGIFVVAPAGIQGEAGLFYAQRFADAGKAFSVGVVDAVDYPYHGAFQMTFSGAKYPPMTYFSVYALRSKAPLRLYRLELTLNLNGETCDPAPSTPKDLSGYAVLLRLDSCPISGKRIATERGAQFLINLYPDYGNHYENNFLTKSSVTLSAADSDTASQSPGRVKASMEKYYNATGGKLMVDFSSSEPVSVVNENFGGRVSYFSEYGPTNELDNPGVAVVAPGANILSTTVHSIGEVEIGSGISYPASYIAGVAALLLSHRKDDKLTPLQLQSLIATTSGPLAVTRNANSPLETIVRQGAGVINAKRAFDAKTLISPYHIALNDSTNVAKTHVITLHNTNSKPIPYSFSSIAGQTLGTFAKDARAFTTPAAPGAHGPPPVVVPISPAKVSFSPPQLTVAPGKSATFTVTIEPPEFSPEDVALVPVYGGWLKIKADGDPVPSYTVPYFGVGSRLNDAPILDTNSDFSPLVLGVKSFPWLSTTNEDDRSQPGHVLTDPNQVVSINRTAGMSLGYRLAMPTAQIILDLVHANTTFRPTISPANNAEGRRASLKARAGSDQDQLTRVDLSLELKPIIAARAVPSSHFPPIDAWIGLIGGLTLSPRDGVLPTDYTTIGGYDGGYLKDGFDSGYIHVPANTPCRIVLRALKLFGDPNDAAGYESWMSPPFSFTA